jgi:hypothetical protein
MGFRIIGRLESAPYRYLLLGSEGLFVRSPITGDIEQILIESPIVNTKYSFITELTGEYPNGVTVGRVLGSRVYSGPGILTTLALYNKTLTTSEQTIVNQCLTTLGA